MARLTPQQVAEKWKRNLQSSTEDIKIGVNAVQENPAQKAIQKKDKLRQNFLQSLDDGSWEAGLNRVTLQDWKNAMINKGISRIASGAEAGSPKMANYVAEVQPYMDNLKSQVDALPDLTLEQNIERMATWVRGMAKFKRRV